MKLRNVVILAAIVALLIVGSVATLASPPHLGPAAVPPEFYVDMHINDTETTFDTLGGQPWWFEIDTYTVTPNTTNSTGEGTLLYGIKYAVTMKTNESGKEVMYRVRLDLADGRTFYTMWSNMYGDTYETVEMSERISNVIKDSRWATGNHDLGLIVDQPYYNITPELAVVTGSTGTVYNQTIELFYFAPMNATSWQFCPGPPGSC